MDSGIPGPGEIPLLHLADLHLGLARYGTPAAPRVADFIATWDRFVAAAIELRVAAVVIAGDTFNTRNESPEVRAEFVAGLVKLRAAGIVVLIIPGNHDGQTTIGDESSHSLRWLREAWIDGIHVFTRPMNAVVKTRAGHLVVTALPYPHKRAMDATLADIPPGDRVLEAGRRLEGIITEYREQGHRELVDAPQLFIGHLTVGGSTAGSEATMRFDWDVAIRPEVLDGFDYAALGHIHRQQPIGAKGWYAGSPEYIDFGEAGQAKGFLHVIVKQGVAPVVTSIPSGARPMLDYVLREQVVTQDGQTGVTKWFWDGGPPGDAVPGSIVRLTLHPLTAAAGARVARKLQEHFAAASFVKVDQVRPTEQRVTLVEVNADLDVLDATTRWLKAHDIQPDRYIEAARALLASA